jgi:hypothetical protein
MIPCYVTMRDLLSWPKALCREIERLGLVPILCDHGSTYPPLLEWYSECDHEIRRYGNDGCYGFWNRGDHLRQSGWYVVTDCDLDLSGVPADCVEIAQRSFLANPTVAKVGVSLEILDIPPGVAAWDQVQAYEPGYWMRRTMDGHWDAGVGATFAIYHAGRAYPWGEPFYKAVRLDRPYTARHLPWYVTAETMDDEYAYYLERIDPSPVYSHWIKHHV